MCVTTCGDGVRAGDEHCDDGNDDPLDGCDGACAWEIVTELEPNDQFADVDMAAPIQFDHLYSGSVIDGDEQDLWVFNVTRPVDVRIEVAGPGGPGTCDGVNPELTVFGFLGSHLAQKKRGSVEECVLMTPSFDGWARQVTPGPYWLSVARDTGHADVAGYTLLVTALTECGNHVVEGYEQCDDADGGCDALCRFVPVCGNGRRESAEQCDDGNTMSGDGCSGTSCLVEATHSCTPAPSTCMPVETACSDGVDNDADGTTDMEARNCMAVAAAPSCPAGTQRWSFATADGNLLIPDVGEGHARILVPDLPGHVARVAVQFSIFNDHTNSLTIGLTSPSGTSTVLADRVGVPMPPGSFSRTVLDDSCTMPISAGSAPYTGCFVPSSPLSGFAGQQPGGAWTLDIADREELRQAQVLGFNLMLCVAP